jgi:iron complex transport system substrate-binding protein
MRNLRPILVSLLFALLITSVAVAQDATEEPLTCDDGFKLVEHALGQICVPEAPQRVFALDLATLELMLITEMQPAAYAGVLLDTYSRMLPELEPAFAEVRESAVDVSYPPNMEAVLESAPDLILLPHDSLTELLYSQFNEIAPTVLYDTSAGDWQTSLTAVGAVLGQDELVAELLADYESRMAELRALTDEAEAPIEVSLVRSLPGQIGLLLPGISGTALVADAGFARPESQSYDYDYVTEELNGRPELLISEEELPLADGDVIFYFSYEPASELTDNPLWQALPGVQAGHAHQVGYYWWGDSLLAAHSMIDDLFEYALGVEPEHPNPFADGLAAADEAESTPEVTPEATEAP